MSIKRGLITFQNQDAFNKDTYINPYPLRTRKHDLRLRSIGLNDQTLFSLQNMKRRSHLQKVRLTFSDSLQHDRHFIKCLSQMPSLKKLILRIDIYEVEDYEGEDSERIIKKFAAIRQLAKKLFTVTKRTVDLEITLFEPLPVYSSIMKHVGKLNQLAKLKIIVPEPLTNNFSYVDNFLSSPRTKKALTKLQSVNIDLSHYPDIADDSPDFLKFSEIVAKITSSLQSYPQPKASLRLQSFISESTIPLVLNILDHSLHLVSFGVQLHLTQDYRPLFDKLAALNHLSSLNLLINGSDDVPSSPSQCSQGFGEYLNKVKTLKELELSLTNIEKADLVTFSFLNKLKTLSQLQRLSLNLEFSHIENEALYVLAHSLSSFSDLQNFTFSVHLPIGNIYEHYFRMTDIFEALKSSSKSLKTLSFHLQNMSRSLNNQKLFVLCETLEVLVELREFNMNAQRNVIDEQGVIKLAKTLSKNQNLEKINIDLSFGVKMENYTLIELLKSFSELKHLRQIDLNISCSEINLATYETVILLLNKLRNLSFFKLKLILDKKATDVKAKFEALLIDQEQYQRLFKFFFY